MRGVVINYVLTKWVFVSLTDEKTGKKADDRLECAEKEKLFKCLFLYWLVDHLTTEVDGTATHVRLKVSNIWNAHQTRSIYLSSLFLFTLQMKKKKNPTDSFITVS